MSNGVNEVKTVTKILEDSSTCDSGNDYDEYDDYDDYDNEYIPDDRLRERDHTKLLEKSGKVAIVLSLYGGFGDREKGQICAGMEKRKIIMEPRRKIWRTNKNIIVFLLDTEVCTSREFDFLRIVWIEKKYFDGPGFWKILKNKEGTENYWVDELAYNLWKVKDSESTCRKKCLLIINSNLDDKQKLAELSRTLQSRAVAGRAERY